MKLVVESLEQLYEVGESNLPPYNYRKGADEDMVTYYYFTTEDDDKYSMAFFNLGEIKKSELGSSRYLNTYDVQFVSSGPTGDTDILNKGRFYRVIATVIEIMRIFAKEKNPRALIISPSKSFRKDKRRFNIYLRYIEKLLPKETYKLKKTLSGNLIIKKK